MNCSPPGFSVHWILQAKSAEVDCRSLLQGIFWPRDGTQVSCIAGSFFTTWATKGSQWFVLDRASHLMLTVEERNLQIKNTETRELSWQARNWHKLGLGNWLLSDDKLPENRDYVLISVLALALSVYLGSYQEPGYVFYKCWAPHSISHDSPQLCSWELAYAEGSRLFPGNLRPRDISCFRRWAYPARIFLKPFCCLISDLHNFWQYLCQHSNHEHLLGARLLYHVLLMAEFIELLLQLCTHVLGQAFYSLLNKLWGQH